MTVRPPRNFNPGNLVETGFSVLEHELMAERASTLGRQGAAVEAALAALAQSETRKVDPHERARLLDTAVQAVWALFVQRDICGLRNNRAVVEHYDIPASVLARLGASKA